MYFRRLWAALLGRPFYPLTVDDVLAVRLPSGTMSRMTIDSMTVEMTMSGGRMILECETPSLKKKD